MIHLHTHQTSDVDYKFRAFRYIIDLYVLSLD